jgi:hypothetical protein
MESLSKLRILTPRFQGGGSRSRSGTWSGAVAMVTAGSPDDLNCGSFGMVHVQRRAQCSDDVALQVARCWVLAPGDAKVGAHPLGEPSFVLVDEHDAVGPVGPVALLVEQNAGQRATERGAAAAAEVIRGESGAELRREPDVEQPEVRLRGVRGADQFGQDERRGPPGVEARGRGTCVLTSEVRTGFASSSPTTASSAGRVDVMSAVCTTLSGRGSGLSRSFLGRLWAVWAVAGPCKHPRQRKATLTHEELSPLVSAAFSAWIRQPAWSPRRSCRSELRHGSQISRITVAGLPMART